MAIANLSSLSGIPKWSKAKNETTIARLNSELRVHKCSKTYYDVASGNLNSQLGTQINVSKHTMKRPLGISIPNWDFIIGTQHTDMATGSLNQFGDLKKLTGRGELAVRPLAKAHLLTD